MFGLSCERGVVKVLMSKGTEGILLPPPPRPQSPARAQLLSRNIVNTPESKSCSQATSMTHHILILTACLLHCAMSLAT